MARLLAWILIAAAATYLTFVGGGWWGIYRPDLRAISLAIAAAAILCWAVVAWRDPSWRPQSAFIPAIGVALASLAISTVFSVVPRISLEYLGYGVVLAALYLLLVQLLRRPFFRSRFTTLGGTLFVLVVAAFVVRVSTGWIEWWENVGRLTIPPLRPNFEGLTYLNPSAVLTMAALLSVPLISSSNLSRRRGRAAVALAILALAVVAVLSGSRAGWLAIALTLVVLPAVWLSMRGNRATVRSYLGVFAGDRRFQIAIAAAGVLTIGLFFTIGPAILLRAGAGGEDLRATLVKTALRMVAESPLVGTGPGTWVIQRIRYTEPGELDYYIPHAHNLEAQTLAELGVLGVVAAIPAFLGFVRLFRGAIGDSDRVRRRWAWATLAALLYFGFHQFFDFYLNMPAFLFAAALPIAYLDATAARPTSDRLQRSWRSAHAVATSQLVCLCVLAAALTGLLAQEVPAGKLAHAVAAADAGDWNTASELAAEAARLDPMVSSYAFTAGLGAAHMGDHTRAAAFFQQVADQDDLPEAWLDLAAEQAALGRDVEATDSLQRALVLGAQRPAVSMPIGELALRLRDGALAINAFHSALLARPSLAADPWWRGTSERAATLDQALFAALRDANPQTRWELELMVGDNVAALSLSSQAGVPMAGWITQAWSGDQRASATVLAYCRDNPLEIQTVLWCARIAGKQGDIDQANAFRAMANTASNGAFELGSELRVSPSGDIAPLFGTPADFWGTYTYRRPTPSNVLVPSLLHLTLE